MSLISIYIYMRAKIDDGRKDQAKRPTTYQAPTDSMSLNDTSALLEPYQ
jgi:hypothetical protein